MKDQYKICIDARMYRKSAGGIGTYTQNLLKEIAKIDKKNEYHIILTKDDSLEYDIKANNFKPKIVKWSHYSLNEQIGYLNFLNKNSFDLVHFTNFNHPLLYQGDYILCIHDLTMNIYPAPGKQSSLFWRKLYWLTLKNGAKNAKKIITLSKNSVKDINILLKVPKEKIVMTYLAAYEDLHPDQTAKSGKRLEKKYKIKKPYILFVSQWRPHKGIENLVKAFAILKKRFGQNKLNLVFSGKPNPNFPQIIKFIKESPQKKQIITPGFIDDKDMAALYSNASLFVFPSFYEGFGLNPLEAMACRTAVAASSSPPMPEVCGKAALYFDPHDTEDMAMKINTALTNHKLRDNLIKQGEKNLKRFSWEKTAKKTLDAYHQVLNSH